MRTFSRARCGLAACVSLLGCGALDGGDAGEGRADEGARSALTTTANQSLLITTTAVTRDSARTKDPCSAVTADADRVWTIGHMLKREAEKNGLGPSTYVTNWMNAWTGTVTINGQTVPPLLGPNVRDAWQKFAGGGTALPLHKAPFWLLAIASRLDLRKHRPLGEPLGGEVRFVFGLLQATTNNPACPTTAFDTFSTIILEYSPAKANENQVRDFGRRWLELSNLTGSAYRSALQTLTEEVINGGRLMRIRTNEGSTAGRVGGTGRWDMGEFEPNATTKFLQRTTIKQSPTMDLASNDSQLLSDWIWANRDALYANAFDFELARSGSQVVTDLPIASYAVPDRFPGTTTWFRGSINALSAPGSEFWNGPQPTGTGSDQEFDFTQARFRFSVGTCRGCHGADTFTTFLHIDPRNGPGNEAGRSAFLTGPVFIQDPVFTIYSRQFDEMVRRENDLRNLVNGSPVAVPVFGNNYTVRFRNSGKCLDSSGNTTTDGARSVLYPCHGNGNQRLSLVPVGTGVYNLKYKHSGKCIDVENGSSSNGARVVQMTCNSSRASQKVTLYVLGGAVPPPRALRFQHSNLCLLLQNQATSDGTPIVQGTCPVSGDPDKGFHLVE